MKTESQRRFGGVLPLPRFVQHPLTSLIVAAVHVYLAGGHLVNLFGGSGVQWTDVWKGFGALGGAYVFTALASRALARQRTSFHASGEADRQSMASPSR
jgi:hypothetical protein